MAAGGGRMVLSEFRRHDGKGLDPGRWEILLSVKRRDGNRMAADRYGLLLSARRWFDGNRLAEDGRKILLFWQQRKARPRVGGYRRKAVFPPTGRNDADRLANDRWASVLF